MWEVPSEVLAAYRAGCPIPQVSTPSTAHKHCTRTSTCTHPGGAHGIRSDVLSVTPPTVRGTCPRTAAMRAAAFQRAAAVAGPHGAAVAALRAFVDYVPDGAVRAAARLL
eukprot:6965761-Prymnesium_polylepis.1